MLKDTRIDTATGVLLWVVTGLVTAEAWRLGALAPVIPWVTFVLVLVLAVSVRPGRLVFVAVAALLSLLSVALVPDWPAVLVRGLNSAGFIAAFFVALSTLRNVAQVSPAIAKGGTFLALQPPGRRYAALTLGGLVFSLMLNYGAISLLGNLATASARSEPDEVIRNHRTRRMLLAIQRGFVASLPWSPLAFAMAITNTLVPGARWVDSLGPGLVSAAILMGTGWALDTLFKPRLSRPASFVRPAGSWRSLSPFLVLLVLIGGVVGIFHVETGIDVPGVVMLVVPVIALGWAVLQHRGGALEQSLGQRLASYVAVELPAGRGEITLLMMAGFIGTVGAPLLLPMIAGLSFDTSALPGWLVLGALVWLIPALGQAGMNPILAVTLITPLVPDPAVMGVAPAAVVAAIAAGWAIGGVSSPFTATTLLIGSFGKVSALHVGLKWNGPYVLAVGTLLTLWVLVYAYWIG